MNILNYIQRLLPTFSKNKIAESCELIQTSIREHTLPAYLSAEELFKSTKFKSEEARDFVSVYEKKVGRTPGSNMIGSIREGLERAAVLLQAISVDSKDIYAETETNISLTYVKATYLRLIEASEFANNYSRKFLNYVFILETASADEHVSVKDCLTPAEITWVNEGFLDFCLCMEILHRDVKDIQKSIKSMPDAMITELTEKTFPSTLGSVKIDPFQMRNLSARVNPYYFVGMMIADYQAKKYKSAKAELELLQLRKFNLEKLHDKSPDAKLQKEIQYMENRVSGLNFEVDKLEKEYLHG